MAIKSHFQYYGNMSSTEKAMNKKELTAYKNYDNHSYALVPGISHSKQITSPLANAGKISLSAHRSSALTRAESPNNSQKAYIEDTRKSYDSNEKARVKSNLLDSMGYNDRGIIKPAPNSQQAVSPTAGSNYGSVGNYHYNKGLHDTLDPSPQGLYGQQAARY